jgi:soluble lytic murein transglycosylase-like protein
MVHPAFLAIVLIGGLAFARPVRAGEAVPATPVSAGPETAAAPPQDVPAQQIPQDAPDKATPRQRFRAIARREAETRGLPPAIADAVMHVESDYNPAARGGAG